MDLDKLLQPYNEQGRTLAGQMQWLLRNGIGQGSVDYAIATVYKRLDLGETFENGHDLDHELLRVAREHFNADLETRTKKLMGEISNTLDQEWNALSKTKKLWEVIRGRA